MIIRDKVFQYFKKHVAMKYEMFQFQAPYQNEGNGKSSVILLSKIEVFDLDIFNLKLKI